MKEKIVENILLVMIAITVIGSTYIIGGIIRQIIIGIYTELSIHHIFNVMQ